MTNQTTAPQWTWLPAGPGRWNARLKDGFISPDNPHTPASVVVHRRDGTASQHNVTSLVQAGSDPVVAVSRHATPVDGLPTPKRPQVRWKHSKKRSRTAYGHRRATVFRIKPDGQETWVYQVQRPDGILLRTEETFKTRAAAARACEQHLTTHSRNEQ